MDSSQRRSLDSVISRLKVLWPPCPLRSTTQYHQPACFNGTSALSVLYEKLSVRFVRSDVSWTCRQLLWNEVHVNEFDAVAEVLRPLCPTTLVDAERFIEFRSPWYLGYPYLFRQASSLTLRIVQSSSWDGVELNQRVLNFDEPGLWTGQSALPKELGTLRLCDGLSPMTDRGVLESMICDQGL